jgi:hypothetical protein
VVDVHLTLISQQKIIHMQRVKYREAQDKIFSLWESFNDHAITTPQLLKKLSYVYGLDNIYFNLNN